MERTEVREQIVAKLAAQFDLDPAAVKDEDNIAKVYGAKSHDLIQLSVSIQAALGVKLGYAESRRLHTVGEWVDHVLELKNK